MLALHQLPPEEERYRQVLANQRAPATDEDNMEDGCSQKLVSAKYLRLLLLILIPCICALILLLVILLTLVGVLGKKCFYSNESDLFGADGDNEIPAVPFPNMSKTGLNVIPSRDNKIQPPSWTTNPFFHVDQNLSVHNEAAHVVSHTPALKTTPTDEIILTKAPGDKVWSSFNTEEETLWSTDTPIKAVERMPTVPVLKPTSPALQETDLKKNPDGKHGSLMSFNNLTQQSLILGGMNCAYSSEAKASAWQRNETVPPQGNKTLSQLLYSCKAVQ